MLIIDAFLCVQFLSALWGFICLGLAKLLTKIICGLEKITVDDDEPIGDNTSDRLAQQAEQLSQQIGGVSWEWVVKTTIYKMGYNTLYLLFSILITIELHFMVTT